MAVINSVLGPLDTSDLGFTLTHEHVLVAPAGVYRDYPELLDSDPVERAVKGLQKAGEGGVDTIVDATTLDLGRNINFLAEASRRSGVNIIACTGWWLDFPRFFEGVSADQLAEVFIREVERGISGTDIKAGILKAASDMEGVKPEDEIVLRAVARAHLKTGVPIMLHSYALLQVERQQLAILKEEGVSMNRVKIDHPLSNTDLEYLTWLLDQGCYLSMDSFPGSSDASPQARARIMKALLDAGYADRLCPSHDHLLVYVNAADPEMTADERMKLNPHGLLYIKKAVFPMLREMGVDEETLNTLCINGPRNFFEGD